MATLIGSGYDALRHLVVYDQPFLGLSWHWSCNNMDHGLSWPDFCMLYGLVDCIFW